MLEGTPMEDAQSHSQPPAQSEDWLAGATIQAEAENLQINSIHVTLEGLDLPDPDPNVA